MALLGDARASKQVLEKLAERAGPELTKANDAADGRLSLFAALRKLCAEHQTLTGPLQKDDAPETARMGKAADARQRLERLRPTERDALVLKLVAGLEVGDIARVCGVDEATAKDRLTKALASTSGEGER
jgi:RNA polymerase sigma-70 factor, ECF subfamily